MGTTQRSALKATFKQGAKDYSLGNHPLWELFRTLYQAKNSPFVIGGLAWAWVFLVDGAGAEFIVSSDVVAFTHREQMGRLKKLVTRTLKISAF